ncbi:TolC family protein [Desulfosarcina sp. OttesenSCG-928-G17]|nr:TolC family protein [Desulfosarcina sp. OttesenSCG-928-G17]
MNLTRYFFVLAVLLGITLGGCATVLPEKSLPDRLEYTETIKNQYHADHQWWKGYNDPKLNRLVELALANNIEFAQTALTLKTAMYQAKLSQLDLFPTLSGSAGAATGRNLYENDSFSQTFSGELGLSYEADVWGKIRDLADAALLEYQATALDRETVRLALVNSVVDVYYNLAYLDGAIAATLKNLENYKEMAAIIHVQYANGKTDVIESLQISQSILSTENSLITYRTQMKENEQTLRNLLNLKPSDSLDEVWPDLMTVTSLDVDLDVPMAVLAERPDLKASETRLQKAFKNFSAEQKSWYPSVSLGGYLRSSADKFGDTLEFPLLGGSLSVNLPFLSWNTVKTRVNISKTEYESALLDFESAITTALNEVAYYYDAYLGSKQTASNTREKYAADTKVRDWYDIRYKSGRVELKDLLESINTVNSSWMDMLSIRYQCIRYENMIYKAMAGRYEAVEDDSTAMFSVE